jgi:tetratricopeptide (TPR) repeat protein
MLFLGRQDRALRCFETIESPTTWQKGVYLALMAHAKGRIEDAVRGWQNCSTFDPGWYFPHYEMAHGYYALGENLKAIDHANQAIKLHPPFHNLWHEIPMRVVMMGSLRKSGDSAAALAEMNSLAARCLVDVVPELLIEKAAQLSSSNDRSKEAIICLQTALEQLKNFPINQTVDVQLMERAISRLCQIGNQCERAREYQAAERCYMVSIAARPNDVWPIYQLVKLELMRGKIFTALRNLHRIARIPNGPKNIIDRVVSASAAARLDAYWPMTARSIVRPLKLILAILARSISRLFRSGFKEITDTVTPALLIVIFVVRHFFNRLTADLFALRRIFRKLPYYLPGKTAYRYRQAKNCPICGGDGKFE